MDRRAFLQVLAYVNSIYASAKALMGEPQTGKDAPADLTYEQVRRKLADSKLYIVPYAHCDWAWAHTRQWQGDRNNQIFDEVLDVLRENPEYRWFFDTKNEMLDPFLDCSPDRVNELKQRIGEGKIGVSGGTICNQAPHWMEGEAFIWNMVLGRRYFEQNFPGVNLDVMTLYDVIVGYTQVPQLLAKGGYKYYRFWRPGGALNAKSIPRQFRWEGLDGTQIICSRGTYAALRSNREIPDSFADNWEQSVKTFYQKVLSLVMNVETYGLVWIANGGDECRPLRASPYEDPSEPLMKTLEFVREWNRREKAPLRFATALDFFREVEARREQLPVIRGVLDPAGWTYWYGTNGNNGLRTWRTRAEELLIGAQKYMALSTLFGEPYPEEALEQLWSKTLVAYSHAQSWLFEDDYQKHLDLVKGVVADAKGLEEEALQRLASRVKVRPSAGALIVFNPLPWERRDVVRLHPTIMLGNTEFLIARDAQGNVLPSQLEEPNYFDARYLKEADLWVEMTVPALGYTTVYVEKHPGKIPLKEETQPFLKLGRDPLTVEVEASGTPALIDSTHGVNYPKAGEVLYQVVEDTGLQLHYGPVVQELKLEGAQVVLLEAGPVRWVGEVRGRLGAHRLRLRISVYPFVRRVEYVAEIDSQGGNGLFLANVTLPFAGEMVAGIPFGVEPRDLTKEPYADEIIDPRGWSIERLRRNVFYAGHWVDISDGKRGLTVIGTKGEKGYIYYPEQRRLGHYLLQTINHVEQGYERFCNRYMEGKGRHVFSYYLLPHAGNWKEAHVPRAGMEVEYPLRAVHRNRSVAPVEQSSPHTQSFLKCTPEHVFLSSLAQSKGRWVIRLYEIFGEAANVRVKLPKRFSSAREIDFNGRPLPKKIVLTGEEAAFEIKPWEIVTLELA